MFTLAFGLEETFYKLMAKHFQWWPERQSLFVYWLIHRN